MKGKKKDKTMFIGGDIENEIQKLKQKEGKNIQIFGSPSVIRMLMQKNLIDEYWFFINPIIHGKGISVFTKTDHKIELSHQTTKVFSCGVSALHFVKK